MRRFDVELMDIKWGREGFAMGGDQSWDLGVETVTGGRRFRSSFRVGSRVFLERKR